MELHADITAMNIARVIILEISFILDSCGILSLSRKKYERSVGLEIHHEKSPRGNYTLGWGFVFFVQVMLPPCSGCSCD